MTPSLGMPVLGAGCWVVRAGNIPVQIQIRHDYKEPHPEYTNIMYVHLPVINYISPKFDVLENVIKDQNRTSIDPCWIIHLFGHDCIGFAFVQKMVYTIVP